MVLPLTHCAVGGKERGERRQGIIPRPVQSQRRGPEERKYNLC